MAATTAAPSVIDLKSSGTLPIRLGASILDSSPSDTSRFLSVRYNHRPRLQQSSLVKATVDDGGENGFSKLSLECEEGRYDYSGRHGEDDDSYVLLSRGQGKDKELVLERVHSSHAFNLTGTPSEHDANTLATRHAHIPIDVGEQDNLFGDDDEDEPAEDSNPFDYRHFLKAELDKPENTNPSLDATRSAAGTPLIQQVRSGGTPVRKPIKPAAKVQPPKKRKPAAAAAKPNAKRVKAGEEPPAETAKSKPKIDVPKVRVDRKASLRRSSIIDDSGELILENETPVTAKVSKPNAMSLALSGQLTDGPISLMSAASTPGEGPSANSNEPEEVMETYEFELGDSSPEHDNEEDNGDLVLEEEEEEPVHADAGEEDHDEDVDPMELPSPAQGRSRPSVSATAGLAGGDEDEDDDLDKQLALAMAEDGDGSEESEEE